MRGFSSTTRQVPLTNRDSVDEPNSAGPDRSVPDGPDAATGVLLDPQAGSQVDKSPNEKAPSRSLFLRLSGRFPILRKKRGIAIVVAVPLILLSGLAGLAALPGSSSGGHEHDSKDNVIQDDVDFYGQSPPVYPSPEMNGKGDWEQALSQAQAMVSNMTLDEKVSLTSGSSSGNGCPGSIPAIERLDFPGLCLGDAGQGLRATDFVSSFSSGLHVGASWNKNLTRSRGAAMGGEFKKKGVNVLLGPVVGPLGRVVSGGRNWEGFSPDPYLSGVLVFESVDAIQDAGVITSTKHFIGNEQETNRVPRDDVAAVSSNIDDKTMHELYLWPFQDAVRAGTGNIMCSYQRVNNSYGCANSKTMNGLLKTELGFQGFVVSDWGAQHAGVGTTLAGMDMAMPGGGDFWGEQLKVSIENGTVPESRIDDMATRIIAAWYYVGQDSDFPDPGIGMPARLYEPHKVVDARDPEASQVLLDGAVEGHVLVKNTKDTLPLKSPRQLSIFGYSAKSPDVFAPVEGNVGSYTWYFGAEAVTAEEVHSGFTGGDFTDFSGIGKGGTLIHGGGSGATTPASFLSPFEALRWRALQNNTAIFHDFNSPRPLVSAASDACLVFGNAWASESYDRPGLRDDYTDELIKSVADHCNKTIVVLHNAGPRLVDQFVDHPNVTAIIFAHLPGQETGNALVSLLYGESNFSGKLPYTVAKNESDYGKMATPDLPKDEFINFPQSDFDEGVYIDYRHFDEKDIDPRYEFGFGMTYTSFEMSNLDVKKSENANFDEWPSGDIVPGGQEDLWDVLVTVQARVENTGDVAGAEVAQLYVGIPDRPSKQLRGFEKPFLEAGEATSVSFNLTRRDLSSWSTERQLWELQRGSYGIFVGSSSRTLPLNDTLTIWVYAWPCTDGVLV